MEQNKQLSSTLKMEKLRSKKTQAASAINYAELYENEKYEEYLKEKERKNLYREELNHMREQDKHRNKLNSLMHLHGAMSPLAKNTEPFTPVKGYGDYLFDTKIANPFIDKQDIINHNRRQSRINDTMEKIKNVY